MYIVTFELGSSEQLTVTRGSKVVWIDWFGVDDKAKGRKETKQGRLMRESHNQSVEIKDGSVEEHCILKKKMSSWVIKSSFKRNKTIWFCE